MKPYKIVFGYGTEDYIEINEDELEKAFYAFLKKKDGVFSGGAIAGSRIVSIQPDYHRAMKWNKGYKLGPLDYEELAEKGVDKSLTHHLSLVKEKVQSLIGTNREFLIGKQTDNLKMT